MTIKKGAYIALFVVATILWAQIGLSASKTTIVVATEDRPLQRVITKYTPEFEKKTGVKIEYAYYPTAELRSKIRLDAALGTGAFQVVYIVEANVIELVAAGAIVPIKDYYPTDYDFDDFFKSAVDILSYKGVPYAAPLTVNSPTLMYRKDLFEKEGIAVPTTLDEYITVCRKFYRPPEIYGGVVRCDRGHGMNVWRWTQFFATWGGKYMENGKFVFDKYIDEAVDTTKYYMEIIKTSPPGGNTFDYLDCWDAFNAGKVATFICANAKYSVTEDPTQSVVAGKVGYALPPYKKVEVNTGCAHGYAISSVGCKTEEQRRIAGQFIAWASSKEMELRRFRLGEGNIGCTRKSTYENEEVKTFIPAEHLRVISECLSPKRLKLCIMPIPEWPEIGDYLGIILEEIFTGMRKDIRSGMEEAAVHAREILGLQ